MTVTTERPKHSVRLQLVTPEEQQKRSLLVVGYLQNLALPSMFNRELTEQDYELWQQLLQPYPLKAIEYAFESWGRNGKQFPKPANILELVGAWSLSNNSVEFRSCGVCTEGWVYLTEGRTIGGHSLKLGDRMVKRCECLENWIASRKAKA